MHVDTSQESEEEKRQQDKLLQIVKDTTEVLKEHFDTVQIFCTKHNPNEDTTQNFRYGSGNYFARIGQIGNWIIEQDSEAVPPREGDDE